MKITHKPYKRQPKLVGLSWDEMEKGPDGRYECLTSRDREHIHYFVKEGSGIWFQYKYDRASPGWNSSGYTWDYLGPGTRHTK